MCVHTRVLGGVDKGLVMEWKEHGAIADWWPGKGHRFRGMGLLYKGDGNEKEDLGGLPGEFFLLSWESPFS